jgi:hypothetical protein
MRSRRHSPTTGAILAPKCVPPTFRFRILRNVKPRISMLGGGQILDSTKSGFVLSFNGLALSCGGLDGLVPLPRFERGTS